MQSKHTVIAALIKRAGVRFLALVLPPLVLIDVSACKPSSESIDTDEATMSAFLPSGKRIPDDMPLQPRFFIGKSNFLGRSQITPENIRARADESNAFHFVLAHALEFTKSETNSIFSGYALHTAFALLYPAMSAGSTSASELANGMVFNKDLDFFYETSRSHVLAVEDAFIKADPDRNLKISLENQVWIDRTYWANQDYSETLKQQFNSTVAALPFKNLPELSVKSINRFVEHNTMGVVKDLLPTNSITPSTTLVLTNALAVSADWELPFDASKTESSDFQNADGIKSQPQFMRQTSVFDYYESGRYQALSMSYIGGKVAMLIVLPRNQNYFSDFVFTFDANEFRNTIDRLAKKVVSVKIPRFDFEWHGDVTEGLKSRGIKMIFTEKTNNFSNLLAKGRQAFSPPVALNNVFHKAKITVTEQSTVPGATSAIAAILVETNVVKQEFEFNVDHPALFFIYEKPYGTILFGGQLTSL